MIYLLIGLPLAGFIVAMENNGWTLVLAAPAKRWLFKRKMS